MQNRYACDVGDMGKFALLKALIGADLQLGVVWYLNPDEEANADAAFVDYPELRACDEQLYDSLHSVCEQGKRSVAAIEQVGILPANTRFFSAPFTFQDLPPANTTGRLRHRERWLSAAVDAVSGADLIFLDPDSGFAPDSSFRVATGSQRYVFAEEVAQFIGRGQSVVVHHHQARNENLEFQLQRGFSMLRARGALHYWAVTFHRQPVHTFFIVSSAQHVERLELRSRELMTTPWGVQSHFQLHMPASDWSKIEGTQAAIQSRKELLRKRRKERKGPAQTNTP
jgi:hypothetical protein